MDIISPVSILKRKKVNNHFHWLNQTASTLKTHKYNRYAEARKRKESKYPRCCEMPVCSISHAFLINSVKTNSIDEDPWFRGFHHDQTQANHQVMYETSYSWSQFLVKRISYALLRKLNKCILSRSRRSLEPLQRGQQACSSRIFLLNVQ